MIAAYLVKPGMIELRETDILAPSNKEVLVKVKAALILHAFLAKLKGAEVFMCARKKDKLIFAKKLGASGLFIALFQTYLFPRRKQGIPSHPAVFQKVY